MSDGFPGPIAAIVVAAGRGERAGGGRPKQYRTIGGSPVLARSLRPFLRHDRIGLVVAVVNPDHGDLYRQCAPQRDKLLPPVDGGATRQESVRRGLEALEPRRPSLVLIHDAARPFLTGAVIDRVIAGLAESEAVLAAVPLADTLKRAEPDGIVTTTPSRDGLFLAQTPQGFAFEAILAAHRQAAGADGTFTDDAAIAEYAGIPVRLVAGDPANTKITTEEDIRMAERLLSAGRETRIGSGYDVHRLGPGDAVILGGVEIPSDRSLIGHSDADVVLHALTDAVLGALAEGDIGTHFPPSDNAWKGASSDRFLADAVARVAARGGTVVHLDATVIAEAPKIGPHREAMRRRIAEICALAPDRVSIKATTNERLGFVGRGEGIAAMATATVQLPADSE